MQKHKIQKSPIQNNTPKNKITNIQRDIQTIIQI